MRILALLLPFMLSYGCGLVVSDRIEQRFMEMNDSLERSTESHQNEGLLAALAPCAEAHEKARLLDSAIVSLKAGIERMKEAASAHAAHNTSVSDSLFQADAAGAALYEGMSCYVRDALLCSTSDSSRARIAGISERMLEKDLAQWHERRFFHMPVAAFMAVLSKMQLDLSNIQLAAMRDLAAQCGSGQPH